MLAGQYMYSRILAVMCSVLVAPENGFISSDDRTCGTQVTYSCKEGYQLSGSENRNCEPNGIWSDNAPVCEAAGKHEE